MARKNNQITLASRIITLALVAFTATNGIFSTKLNAKADNTNANNSTSHNDNKKANQATLVSASVSPHNSKTNKSKAHQALHKAAKHIKSRVLLNYTRKASNTVNRIESSSIASNLHKRAIIRSSFTSTSNYYRPVSDITSASSSAQPKLENRGNSLGINKTTIQNRYPAEFQSLNNAYQNASMKTSLDTSKANNANQYLSTCKSLNNRSQRETFSWHSKFNPISSNTYQNNLNSQYQQLSSTASYIYNVKSGLSNTNYITKQLDQTKDLTHQNALSIRADDDAKSLAAVNQNLANNNNALKLVNREIDSNQSKIHNIHVSKYLMNLNNQSVNFQSTSNQSFINQVIKRCIQNNNHRIQPDIEYAFKNVINEIAKDYKLKGLNNYSLFNQLKAHNIIIYTDHNGNLINITPNHKINQKYTYAFPLYTTDYLNLINTVNNIATRMDYKSLNSTSAIKLNQIRQRVSLNSLQLNSLKSKNQILSEKENALLNQWKLDSFLLSKPKHQPKLNQFYKKYLNDIVNVDNQIYYGALGINIYLFNPKVNSYSLLTKKNGQTGTNLKLGTNDLSQINQAINRIYTTNKSGSTNKYQAIFQPNDVILPRSIFQSLQSHNYRLANGQSVIRNIILCSVKYKKGSGNLNLYIKFQRCNHLNDSSQLSDHNDIYEMIPILHNYYPLGTKDITDATKSILSYGTSNSRPLKDRLYLASSAVNNIINKYQSSLSNFINYSGINKELASAKYFANSYASDVKSDQSNVSLAAIALDTFYMKHAPQRTKALNDNSANHSSKFHSNWQHIPQYIYVNSGTPIYGINNHHINHIITNSTLHVVGIGTDHDGHIFYKVSHHHQINYVPANSKFITNAYYSAQNNVFVNVLRPTQAYYDAKLTVPYKIVNANTHIKGEIKAININSEKTIFKSMNGNYLPADTQHIKIIK